MAENKFRIPEESVDLILDSVNIVEVIEESIPLKKSGQNYFACCPFHKESTPSFSVSEYKQFYHCFGCGAHGDAIEFLKAYKKDSFVSAAMSLAHRGGINLDLPKESTTDYIPVGRIKETLGELAVKYQANLTDNRLPITRVSRSTAEYFGLGIALPESNLTNDFTSKDQRQWLLKSGLTTKANDDAFQNRLMLPLTDRKGEVVGFSGLTLDPNTESQDRTLYTTSEYFELDNHLYGEWQSLMSDSDDDHLFIVENVLYTLLFHDAGITNTIGTIFGIPNDQQLKRILRRSENITFIFNDTQKGRDNAEKTIKKLLRHVTGNHVFKFVFSNSVSKLIKDTELTTKGLPLSTHLLSLLNNVTDNQRLGRLRTYLSLMPDTIYRTMFIDLVQSETGITEEQLYDPEWDDL